MVVAHRDWDLAEEIVFVPQRTGHYFVQRKCTLEDGTLSDWIKSYDQNPANRPEITDWWFFAWIAAPTGGGFE
jgi:hypothetical protein